MPRILIVDDEEPVRSMLFEFLSFQGYECTMAANAKEARTQLENNAFDLVLSDLNMPGESGMELLEYVFSGHPNTLGMILTAMNDSGFERRALEMGVSAYMTKPFLLNKLLHNIAEALRRQNQNEGYGIPCETSCDIAGVARFAETEKPD